MRHTSGVHKLLPLLYHLLVQQAAMPLAALSRCALATSVFAADHHTTTGRQQLGGPSEHSHLQAAAAGYSFQQPPVPQTDRWYTECSARALHPQSVTLTEDVLCQHTYLLINCHVLLVSNTTC